MSAFEHKLVAILNKQIETGVAMNALGHMAIGLSSTIEKPLLRLDTYEDKEGTPYPFISQMPFIVLRGKSGEIRKTVLAAREHHIVHTVFLNTMTGGTYLEQLERTKATPEQDLIYYGCVLFGPWAQVTELTRKFSLWKQD
jgi:hypothetical protein